MRHTRFAALALSALASLASAQTGQLDQSNTTPANITTWMAFAPFTYQQVVQAGRTGVLEGFRIRIAPGGAASPPLAVAIEAFDNQLQLPGAPLWTGTTTAPNTGTMQNVFVDVRAANLSFNQGDFFVIRVGDPNLAASDWNLSLNSGWDPNLNMPYAQYPHTLYQDGNAHSIERLVFQTYVLPPSIGVVFCTPGTANSTGQVGVVSASGSVSVAANALSLRAASLPPNAFGFFLTTRLLGAAVTPPASMGQLCLSGSIGRYVGPGQIQSTGTTGAFSLALDLTNTPQPTGPVAVAVGETWHFQAWHRDSVQGSATSNFTRGLSVTFQ